MNEKVKKVKKDVEKFLKKFEEIEFSYIYGSSLTKENPNDVDVLCVVRDEDFESKLKNKYDVERKKIMHKYKDIMIHIQPLQPLSNFWKLILTGEPWMISSLESPLILKDKNKTLDEISEIVKNNLTFEKEEVADNLLKRSQNYFLDNRELLLKSIINLSEAATESLQLVLLFNDKLVLDKKKILKEFENKFADKIKISSLNTYREIIDLEEKMLKGNLTEFSCENLDYYKNKVKFLVDDCQRAISGK